MRRLGVAVVAVVATTVLAPPGAAQERGTITGRIILGNTDRGVEGVDVTLLGARVDGTGRVIERTDTTNEDGRFVFEVAKREGLEFALEATYDGGLFVGASFPLKGAGVTSNVEVWKTTSDPSVISIERDHMFVMHDEDGAGVLESVTVANGSQRAYVGRGHSLGGGDGNRSPTLGFALPTQSLGGRVDLIDSSLNRLYAVEADFGFAATVAIPPGETTVTFAYPAEGTAGSFDLTRRALYPTEELSVFVTDPLDVEAGRLSYDGIEEVSDRRYRVWRSDGALDAGDVVSLLVIAQGETSSNLWAGLAAGFGAIVLLIAAAMWLRSRTRRGSKDDPASTPRPRRDEGDEDLVAAIAALDLAHESGSVGEEQWQTQRSALKKRLAAAKQRERTP